jgi:hypothetical protein
LKIVLTRVKTFWINSQNNFQPWLNVFLFVE